MQENRKKLSTPRLALVGLGVVVAVIVAVILPMSGGRRDAATERALGYMRSDLQGLVVAQNMSRNRTGNYVADADAAGHLSTFGVSKPLVVLSGDGWYGTVTHQQYPNLQCAVAVRARNPLSRFADDGEIACK